jgi:hypothetical protein
MLQLPIHFNPKAMKTIFSLYLVIQALCMQVLAQNRIGCVCQDNTYSKATGSGACAGHGGVKQWLYAQPPTSQRLLPASTSGDTSTFRPEDYEEIRISDSTTRPSTTTPQPNKNDRIGCECRDGTLSRATGSGACSGHGGVARWLYGGENLKDEVLTPTLRPRPRNDDDTHRNEEDDGSFSFNDFERAGSLFVYILALVLVFLKVSWVLRRIMRRYLDDE